MIEVELKYRLPPGVDVVTLLAPLGAHVVGEMAQRDLYFQHPVRDFRQTDEAFRIRCADESNVLTYKGPLLDKVSKTRHETEIAFASGAAARDQMRQMLESLGFTPQPPVVKRRTEYAFSRGGQTVHVCHDRVEGLGEFLELETLAPPDRWEPARDVLLVLATELGLTLSERKSYLQLLSERNWCREYRSETPRHQVGTKITKDSSDAPLREALFRFPGRPRGRSPL